MKILFKSDDKVEQRGYRLVFTLVSPASVLPHGKLDYKKELFKLIKFIKFISLLNKSQNFNCTTKTETRVSDFQYAKIGFLIIVKGS